ncbi:MAG: glycosyltransferase family 4 protein [Ancalomicrobiaceae bacterium]|nr:glycosyltransferase family 4 protein [Ancalomicrobiaceae bacterium]
MIPTIVQVIQEYSNAGGAETVAYELSKSFSRLGAANAVLTSKPAGTPDPSTEVRVVWGFLSLIPTRGPLRYLGRLLVVPLFSLISSLSVRRRRSDIVISHGDCMRGDIMVIHAVNAASLAVKRADGAWTWRLNPMHLWVGLRDRWTLGHRRFRRYVAVSRRVESELMQHYGVPAEQISIIPNGIDLTRFASLPEARISLRQTYAIPPTAKVLLFVGHEFGRKGLDYVVRAMQLLDQDTWLVVVGSDDPAPFRRIAPELDARMVFAGAKSNVSDFYAAADLFVFPTNYETFSLVSMEALACGLPVLATRVGGIEDYLVDGENGYFIERNPEQIADAVRRVFADRNRYERLKLGARQTAEHYDWQRIGRLYLDLIEKVAQERAGQLTNSTL